MTKITFVIIMNLVAPKAGAKHEVCSMNQPLRPEASLLDKISCSAPALGVTKINNCRRRDFDHTML